MAGARTGAGTHIASRGVPWIAREIAYVAENRGQTIIAYADGALLSGSMSTSLIEHDGDQLRFYYDAGLVPETEFVTREPHPHDRRHPARRRRHPDRLSCVRCTDRVKVA